MISAIQKKKKKTVNISVKIEYKKDDWNMCCFCASSEIPTAQLLVFGTNLSDKVPSTGKGERCGGKDILPKVKKINAYKYTRFIIPIRTTCIKVERLFAVSIIVTSV